MGLRADPIVSWYVETPLYQGDPPCQFVASLSLSVDLGVQLGPSPVLSSPTRPNELVSADLYESGCRVDYTSYPYGEGYDGKTPYPAYYEILENHPVLDNYFDVESSSVSGLYRTDTFEGLSEIYAGARITLTIPANINQVWTIPAQITFSFPAFEDGVWGPDQGSGPFDVGPGGQVSALPVPEAWPLAYLATGLLLLLGLGWRRQLPTDNSPSGLQHAGAEGRDRGIERRSLERGDQPGAGFTGQNDLVQP